MGLTRRCRSGALAIVAGALLAMGWISTAIAQAVGGDGDGDGDEFTALAVVVGVAAAAVVGWLAYQRKTSRSR